MTSTANAMLPEPLTESALTISQASAATGTPVETLRYYERVGVLPSIDRGPTGRRLYSSDDLGWVRFVRRLRGHGGRGRLDDTHIPLPRVPGAV